MAVSVLWLVVAQKYPGMQQSNKTVDYSKDPKLQLLESLIRECFAVNTTHSEVYAADHEPNEGKSQSVKFEYC